MSSGFGAEKTWENVQVAVVASLDVVTPADVAAEAHVNKAWKAAEQHNRIRQAREIHLQGTSIR